MLRTRARSAGRGLRELANDVIYRGERLDGLLQAQGASARLAQRSFSETRAPVVVSMLLHDVDDLPEHLR